MPLLWFESGTPSAELSGKQQFPPRHFCHIVTNILKVAAATLHRDVPESSVPPESSSDKWPRNTDLVFPASGGTTRLLLSRQNSLIQSVVQGAIENMRASLMFNHAFPDGILALSFAKESLIIAAESLQPGAAPIRRRLEFNEDYLTKMAHMVIYIHISLRR